MANLADYLGIKNVEEVKEKVDSTESNYERLKPGVYTVKIIEAYLSKSQSGATRIDYTFETEDGQTLFINGYIKSGDEKGNSPYYVDKNGNEIPLPDFRLFMHLLCSVGVELNDINPKPAVIEKFGNQYEVQILEELIGKIVKIGVRYKWDYYNNEEGKIKYDVVDFIKVDGSDCKGNADAEEKLIKKIENKPEVGKKEVKENKEIKEKLNSW
jgi:hypothetical protein